MSTSAYFNGNSGVVGAKLEGFPKAVEEIDVAMYLSNLLYDGQEMQIQSCYFSILQLTHHNKSSSIVVGLYAADNFGSKKMLKQLCTKVKEAPFRLKHHITAGRHKLDLAMLNYSNDENVDSNRQQSPTSLPNCVSEPTVEKKKKRKKKKNKSKNNQDDDMNSLAVDFHKFLLSDLDSMKKASSRDGAHIVFEKFAKERLQQYHDSKNGNGNKKTNYLEANTLCRTEALVMARLRQKRLLRTKRHGTIIVMSFAIDETRGNFGSHTKQTSQFDLIRKSQLEQQSNKHDVIVSIVGGPPGFYSDGGGVTCTVNAGETQQIDLAVRCPEKGSGGETSLEKLILTGPHSSKFYKIVHQPHLPLEIQKSQKYLRVHVSVKPPHRVGVFRSALECHFVRRTKKKKETHFTITRFFTVKSTHDKAIEKSLQPIAPYEGPKHPKHHRRSKRGQKHDGSSDQNVLGPLLQDKCVLNPFKDLPYYTIPADVFEMLMAKELETVLHSPCEDENHSGTSRLNGKYGEFWRNILWAYEFQLASDIEMFDMEKTSLKRDGKNFTLTVPGLAEGRPSVLRGDIVELNWKGNTYRGHVQQIRLLDIVFESHSSFHKNFNTALDTVDVVRFTVNRMIFRTMHHFCAMAEEKMKELMLIPSQIHVDDMMASDAKIARHIHSEMKWANLDLNDEQKVAVKNILEGVLRPLPYIIYGPPGTGKTTTVVETVYQLAKYGDGKCKILLTAPSNDAADVLVERLASYFPQTELRRIIAYSRPIETIPAFIKAYVSDDVHSSELQLRDIMSARIVVSTLNLAARFSFWGVPRGYFDVMCVDEAGHAMEPEIIAVASSLMDFQNETPQNSVSSPGQLILAGDPRQLGPIVTSDLCRKFKVDVSYMERLMGRDVYSRKPDGKYPEKLLTKLVRNYRSHPAILMLPNKIFYDGDLKCCGNKMVTHSLEKWEHLPVKGFPLLFHAVEGENLRESNSPSWFNPQEAEIAIEYTKQLLYDTRPPLKADEIGIITPYARQAQKIRLALEAQNIEGIKVGSVESFQGQEKRCIIVSTVRAEADHLSADLKYNLGFVANEKRFNVALTRAKAILIVIGCPEVLVLDKAHWLPFLEYCRENGAWCGEDWSVKNGKSMEDLHLLEEDWETLAVEPSQTAEQGAFPLMHREE